MEDDQLIGAHRGVLAPRLQISTPSLNTDFKAQYIMLN